LEHILHLFTNPFILFIIVVVFFGEYLPFSRYIWNIILKKIISFGNLIIEKYENFLYTNKEEYKEKEDINVKIDNFFLRVVFFAIAIIVVIFLEIFWELGFSNLLKYTERTSFAQKFEEKMKEYSPSTILILFLLPFAIMETMGAYAVYLFASGYLLSGLLIYILKVALFVPVHFILHKGKEKLLSIKWFERRYTLVINILKWYKQTQSYIKVHNKMEIIKGYYHSLKEIFISKVKLIKKAFEEENLLSSECRDLFNEISIKEKNDIVVSPEEYQNFFECFKRTPYKIK